jgi:hypothetical protein
LFVSCLCGFENSAVAPVPWWILYRYACHCDDAESIVAVVTMSRPQQETNGRDSGPSWLNCSVGPVLCFIDLPPITMMIAATGYCGMLYYSWGGSWANRDQRATSCSVGDTWLALASTAWKYALLLYLPYFMLSDNTPNTTGWPSTTAAMGFLRPILRSNVVYRWMAQYFPATLRKTGDIPAEAPGSSLYFLLSSSRCH